VFWLFLDLLAAEGLVVFMTSLFPSFVISLALVAFANGLWMSVDGFMVQPGILNVFYKYVFHYWDYQKYVFENMMINEFSERVYTCASTADGCQCEYLVFPRLFFACANAVDRYVANGSCRPMSHPGSRRARPVRVPAGTHAEGYWYYDGHYCWVQNCGLDRTQA